MPRHDAQKGTKVDKRKPKEGNVPRRDLKKEGKCLCSKGQLSATVAEATGAAAIDFRETLSVSQLSQAAGAIADSQPRILEKGAACYTFEFVPSTATAPPNPGFPSISTLSESHGDAPGTGSHAARPSAPFSRSRCCCSSSCGRSCCVAPLFFPRRPPPSPA
jgi:hypothetical protein